MSLQTKLVTGGVQSDTLQDVDCSGGYIPRRYVFTLCGFCAVTICMVASTVSLVIVPISRELGWSDATKGVVLSGYYYGYSPCCAVGGALALRFNRPTAQVLLLPLATTALLQLALPSLVMHLKDVPCLGLASCSEVGMFVVLMLTGMVQATLNPALHRMISVWSPVAERSAQHNFIYSGQQAGQMIGLATGGLIIDGLGWRAVFYINAAALGSFALVWAALVADSPRLHSGCSRQETAMIETDAGEPHGTVGICSMPWGQILRTPAVLVLFVNHWVMGWSSSTIQSWTPTWLTEELHFDIKSSGFVSALPPLIGFGVSTLSGLLATHLITTGKASVSGPSEQI
jgi:sugar phosphate permease